mmetsp:Transcript_116190/g.182779  ORF Transcript_116190/g.182779 Transcript_116190/m.182779 type:complete len:469 (+) Transcript_116190:98-1504(+)
MSRGYQAREGRCQENRIGCRLSPDGTWNSQTPISPGSKPRQNCQWPTGALRDRAMRNCQSHAAGVDSVRLKHHWGKACLSPASPPERLSYSLQGSETYDMDDGWSEYSATVPAGLASTRVHPSMPLYKSSWNPHVQPMPGTTCIRDIKTKKRVAGPQACDNLMLTDDVETEANGKTWRRTAYTHAAAQQNWKLNTSRRLDKSQSVSLQNFSPGGIAGEQHEWTYSKPRVYYNSSGKEPTYFVAGAEDAAQLPSRNYYVKADLPPSKGLVKYNDKMSMPYYERQRKSFNPKVGNPQLESSGEIQTCMRPFGVSARFSPRNSRVLPTSAGENVASSEGQAQRACSRQSSMRSVQEKSADSLQSSLRSLNAGAGGYPVLKTSSSIGSNRPKYDYEVIRHQQLSGSTMAPSARGSLSVAESRSSATSKIVPRSPLTWETQTMRSPESRQRGLEQSGARSARLATGRKEEASR